MLQASDKHHQLWQPLHMRADIIIPVDCSSSLCELQQSLGELPADLRRHLTELDRTRNVKDFWRSVLEVEYRIRCLVLRLQLSVSAFV